jgi:hypothetical protein
MVAPKGFVFKDLPVSRRKHSPKLWRCRREELISGAKK